MNEEKELELLKNLKTKLISAEKNRGKSLSENDFGSVRWSDSKKKEFYLYDARNNLFEEPHRDTALGTGVEAVRSSAAMIFNLLGQKTVVINGISYSEVEYEKELKAIKDEEDIKHNAHLDVALQSSDNSEMMFIEAKMMEWINTPKKLSPAYLDSNMYFYSDVSLDFIEFFRSLVDEQKKPAYDGRLIRKNKRYDAIQMAIHILAIYNYCRETKTAVPKKVSLQNVVWAYGCDDYDKEQSEGKEFVEKANNTFSPIFEKLGIDFSVEYVTFQDFKARIDFTNDKDREAYLTRYEI